MIGTEREEQMNCQQDEHKYNEKSINVIRVKSDEEVGLVKDSEGYIRVVKTSRKINYLQLIKALQDLNWENYNKIQYNKGFKDGIKFIVSMELKGENK